MQIEQDTFSHSILPSIDGKWGGQEMRVQMTEELYLRITIHRYGTESYSKDEGSWNKPIVSIPDDTP